MTAKGLSSLTLKTIENILMELVTRLMLKRSRTKLPKLVTAIKYYIKPEM
jgi:hypothetical protein